MLVELGYSEKVSIHAPVKGATLAAFMGGEKGEVSIHAPVKGATFAIENGLLAR